MLIHNYFWYLSKILFAGLFTPQGILALLLFAAALGVWMFAARSTNRTRLVIALFVGAFVLEVVTVYTAEYEFVETDEFVNIAKTNQDDADCGLRTEKQWFGGHVGLINPCPKSCYRGATTGKRMKMFYFPPWPRYQRTVQCWKRSGEFPLY